jgi:diketogulonate reductase-like aldo/keto reductase
MDNTSVPQFFYGTAWKEHSTAELTFKALETGFRAIDTANQRKHYYEEAVGNGLARAFDKLSLRREELFLQTKYTFPRGQDHRMPYNESDPIGQQVEDSCKSSLSHLGTDYLDSYVLHGPYRSVGIGAEDLDAWQAMEGLYKKGLVKNLGISNVSPAQLAEICQRSKIKPRFVQNRCFARLGWDIGVRTVCIAEGITYQGFSLLTANQAELSLKPIGSIAEKYKKTVPQVVFRFCLQLGMICLTGTTNQEHMRHDLDTLDFELTSKEMGIIENISFEAYPNV